MQTLSKILQWVWNNLLSKNILLAVCAGVVILFSVQQCRNPASKYEKQLAVWQAEAKRAEAINTKDSAQIRTLMQQTVQLQIARDSIDSERLKVATYAATKTKSLDSVLALLNVPHVSSDSCALQLGIANQYKTAYDSLNKAYQLSQQQDRYDSTSNANNATALLLSMSANDSLRAALLRVPIYKPEKILNFIPMPSRKASFAIGAVLGAAAVLAIESHK